MEMQVIRLDGEIILVCTHIFEDVRKAVFEIFGVYLWPFGVQIFVENLSKITVWEVIMCTVTDNDYNYTHFLVLASNTPTLNGLIPSFGFLSGSSEQKTRQACI